jgi:hypothetical protein
VSFVRIKAPSSSEYGGSASAYRCKQEYTRMSRRLSTGSATSACSVAVARSHVSQK